jgi:tetratricopeptide (TPR) repeat protein
VLELAPALAEAGVAEAAYRLGVGAFRRGEHRNALEWLERSLALNPEHA